MADHDPTQGPADDLDEYEPENVDDTTGSPLTLAELRDEAETARRTFTTLEGTTGETLIVDGRNVAVRVRAGCLEVEDGVHPHRRTRTVTRADAGRTTRRVLVLGAGIITTEAMLWCLQQDVPLVVARTRTTPTMVGAPVLFDHAGLRRAQALTGATPAGMPIVRWLLDRRLADQARIADGRLHRDDQADAIHALRRALGAARTVENALSVEGQAADRYWSCWRPLEVRFAAADRPRVPDHWRHFGGRRSPLGTGGWSNRHAANPLNALLNFGFKVAEVEATVACLALGLDPSLGWVHAVRQGRPAAALDLMEVGRGVVEETVLDLVALRTFRKADFSETGSGEVRVRPPLSHELASALTPLVSEAVGTAAEQLAAMVAAETNAAIEVPTPLSSARRGRTRKPRSARFANRCHGCGLPQAPGHDQRSFCDDCLPGARSQRGLAESGTAGRRRPRPARRDYATEGDRRRAETMTARVVEQQAWEREHRGMRRPDPSEFAPIAAGLTGVPLAQIAESMNVSITAASRVRRGLLVPHVRHWQALAILAASTVSGCASP